MPRKDSKAKGFGPVSEEHCRETIERAPDAILFLDTKGKIVYCNAATARMTGFKKTELIGAHYNRLGALRLLDIPKYMLMFHDLLGGRDIKPFETTWRNKRGEIVYTEAHVGTIKEKGKIKWVQAIVRDLTERRGRGESLEESEERYKTMIDESAYAMMLVDTYGNLIFSNKATDTITGRQYMDDTGKDILRLGIISKADIPKVKKAMGDILSGKKIEPFEIRMIRADNVDLIVEAHGVRVDYMGEPAVLATLRDITPQKKAEDALKESEAKYRSLVENATDQIFMLDNEGRLLSVNKTIANLLRKPANELIGKPISRFFPKETAVQFSKNVYEVFKTGEGKSLEEKMSVGGREFYNSTSLNPVKNEKGETIAVTGIVRDVTKQKKAEEALQIKEGAIESSINAIAISDLNGNLNYVNPAFLKLWGYRSKAKVLGRKAVEFWKMGEKAKEIMGAVQRYGGWIGELTAQRNDGSLFDVQISASIVLDTNGKPTGMMGAFMDLTERKRTEATLRESEERVSAMLENAPEGIALVNMKGAMLYINKSGEEMIGYKRKELVNKNIPTLIGLGMFYKEEVPKLMKITYDALRGNPVRALEMRLRRKDGKELSLEINASQIAFRNEKAMIVSFIDITERKKAEEELKGSEERFELLFEYAPDAYYINNMKGTFIDGNKAAERLTGYSKKELIGKSFLKLNLLSMDQILKAAGLLRKNLVGQPTGPDEFVLSRKDGSKVNVEISTYPIKIEDKLLTLGIARDITERKKAEEEINESEERFRSIFENANDGIILADAKSKKFYISNKRFQDMIGYSAEEIKKMGVMEIHPKKDLPYVLDQFEKQTKRKISLAKDLPVKRKDGSVFYADVNAFPINLAGKQYLTGMFRDTTERKKAEELIKNYSLNLESEVKERTHELTEEKEKVEALSVVKDEFIKNISHELKTPLSVIMGNLTLLRDMAPAGREKEWSNMIDMMDRNSNRLSESVNQILQVSKLSTMGLKKERIYLKELLNDVYKERLPIAKKKDLKFELQAEPITITGDSSLIRLAVGNLVSNAIKFTQKGSVTVSVKVKEGTVSISVTDTGIGISPENQKRMFEKFFKADENAPGTGIGLNIAKQIIERHGGSINVKSGLGKGSTFEIVLPRGTEAKVEGEVKVGIKRKGKKHKVAVKDERLLLAGIAPKEWAK